MSKKSLDVGMNKQYCWAVRRVPGSNLACHDGFHKWRAFNQYAELRVTLLAISFIHHGVLITSIWNSLFSVDNVDKFMGKVNSHIYLVIEDKFFIREKQMTLHFTWIWWSRKRSYCTVARGHTVIAHTFSRIFIKFVMCHAVHAYTYIL